MGVKLGASYLGRNRLRVFVYRVMRKNVYLEGMR
jgi:hypothetical protein